MSTVTIPARAPRATRRSIRAGRSGGVTGRPAGSACRRTGPAVRVLPDGSVRISAAVLHDAARRSVGAAASAQPLARAVPAAVPTLTAVPMPVPGRSAPVRAPRRPSSAPLRLVPTRPAPSTPVEAPAVPAAPAALVDRPVSPVRARPARPAQPSQSSQPSVRITRRGRLVLTLLALVALVSGLLAVTAAVGQPVRGLSLPSVHAPSFLTGGGQVSARRVTVRPGDTLWGIAERAVPGADPRDTIATIESLNDLSAGDVQAGTVLRVPARH